ncbi:sensor histidine kinase [Paenibacillaceae bacterium]|nr:sensor histidine kinase [Paenibacillaceae bacterium]
MTGKKQTKGFIPFGYKLMLSYCLLIILPVIIVAYIANSVYVKSIREQTSMNIHATLQQITDNVKYKLDDAIRVSDLLYYDSKLIRIFGRKEEGWAVYDSTANYVLPKLQDVIKSTNSSLLLTVYLHNETLPEVYYLRKGAHPAAVKSSHYDIFQIDRISDKQWYTEFPPENYGVTLDWKQIEDDKERGLISLLRRMVDVGGFPSSSEVAFIRITFNLNELLESTDYRKIGEGSNIFIVDENEELVYHSGEKEIPIEELESEQLANGYLVIKEELPYLNWKLVTLVPTDIMEKDINRVTVFTLIVCMICFIVFLLIGVFLSNFFSKRVGKIVSVLRSFREGDFHKRMNYRGNDEFLIIAQALNRMGGETEALIDEVYLSNIKKKEAELESLQAQINPHFLYNTLSSISSLAKLGEVDKLNRMVIDLAKFYRLSLNEGKTVIMLRDELAQAQAYVNIQRTKYGDRIRVAYEIDSEALEVETIKLILQPIIENVFEHAWKDSYLNMRITVQRDGELVRMAVNDDGAGMDPDIIRQIFDPLGNLNVGYGVRNVDQRIKLHFGKQYGVAIDSEPGQGTTVTIAIPYINRVLSEPNH